MASYSFKRSKMQYLIDASVYVFRAHYSIPEDMMDGDGILFNRQPTLHRMSMMCHRVKIMKQGNTFRMNVADTKPYNADQLLH